MILDLNSSKEKQGLDNNKASCTTVVKEKGSKTANSCDDIQSRYSFREVT